MKHLYRPTQTELQCRYESAKQRVAHNSELAEEYRKRLQQLPIYTNEEEAVKAFIDISEHGSGTPYKGDCFVWAKIEVDEEFFCYKKDFFLVTDDNLMHQAAEFIGMCELLLTEE